MTKKHMIKDFTPVLDTIIEKLDILSGMVYGRVWRYCQMEEGKCFASQKKLANDLGVSTKTIERRLKLLVKEKYLVDLTPERRHQTHEYLPTGKAGIKLSAEAYDKTESPTSKTLSRTSKTESPTKSDLESVKESNKKQNNKPNKKEIKKKGAKRQPVPPGVGIYRAIVKRYPNKLTYPVIHKAVGEKPDDLARWKAVIEAWILKGYNPHNVEGLVRVFKEGWKSYQVRKNMKQDSEAERQKYVEGKYADHIDH